MVTTSTHSQSAESVMELRGVSKIFRTADHTDRAVLEGVDLNLRQGETAIKGIGHFNIDKNPKLHERSMKEIKLALKRR